MQGKKCLLEMREIQKSFSGVPVLQGVNFSVAAGEVHALVGENGAGKSTLMKILCGIYSKDKGEILLDGQPKNFHSPADARNNRISIVHQEICLAENMSVADNIFLGIELNRRGFVCEKAMRERAQKALDSLNAKFSPDTIISTLSVAQKQMVEIAIAICFDAKIVIFDEPTAALTDNEIKYLFEQIAAMKQRGLGIIYISHRLEEIFEIADTVTVLRNGVSVDSKPIKETTSEDIIRMMVGRELDNYYSNGIIKGGDTAFEVRGLRNKFLKDISFELKRGEILGVFGLVGAGRTEMARAIFGIDKLDSGELFLDGRKINNNKPADAIKNGIALVPEDRKLDGLVLGRDVAYNITLTVLKSFISGIHINRQKEQELLDKYAKKLSIKMSGYDQLCQNLSGGNQQKVVISKWLATGSKVLIMDEPTRGIDVGAKAEIYSLMRDLAADGISIIMISSELPEIINMSSRVAVMYEGHLNKIMTPDEGLFTQERIMHYAVGGQD